MKKKRKNSGFTIIELILVIAIIGVIAAMSIPKYIDIRQNAEENVAKNVQAQIEATINLLHANYILTGQTYTAQDVVSSLNLQGMTVTIEDI